MSGVIITAYFCIIIPTCLMLGFLEARSRVVYGYMIIGVNIALIASQVNTFVLNFFDNDYFYVTTNFTPAIEEILKAIPILFFVFFVPSKKSTIISVSFAVGFGFALLENSVALLSSTSTAPVVWIISRGIGAGLMHGLCTGMVGWGLSRVKYSKKITFTGIFALLTLAILFHSTYNIMVESDNLKYFGIIFPSTVYIPLLVYFISGKIKKKYED